METQALRFINDIVKPWDELNQLLSLRLALQPDLSDVTRLAGSLAVAIRHQTDALKVKDAHSNAESHEHRVISDTADFWKHGSLRNSARNISFTTEAYFEYSIEKGFSFIRNALVVEHATFGRFDFMHTSRSAINYWLNKHNILIDWGSTVRENLTEFHSTAFLNFDPNRCVSMRQVCLTFFSRNKGGLLERVDPLEVHFEVR